MRKHLLAGNWKMFKTPQETAAFFQEFLPAVTSIQDRDIAICPAAVNIPAAVQATQGTQIRIGGQNLHWKEEGAFTGEVSGRMLKAAGCSYVIVGHSERRQYFGETDETVLLRTRAALKAGLEPIVCVGERLEEREAGRTEAVLETQFRAGLAPLSSDEFRRVVIAYEPVWAIGTGRTATPETATEAHRFLRRLTRECFGDAAAQNVRILYGGSVNPQNIASLMASEEIDGALVGGASLDPQSFAAIVKYDACAA